MSQKYIKSKNNNSHNAKTYGKYYAKPVYDEKFVETDEIADFIQTQATLKRSDITLSGSGPEDPPGRHRHLQGRLLQHRRREGGGLHSIDHHLAPRTVPA